MKVLFVLEKDAANASLGRIANQFKIRNHQVIIFAQYFSSNVLRFFDKNTMIFSLSEIKQTVIDECDIIFASMTSSTFLANKGIFFVKKPIFIQNYLIDKQIGWEGDICFVPSLDSVKTDYDEYVHCTRIGIGEPKYERKAKVECYNNRILFIDSGHYPFGLSAKKELARILLHICITLPEYDLVIKPRFLPQDVIVTHRNGYHLYDVINEEAKGNIPANLIMLKEHRNLQELIDQSHTVICMYTTAFVGACVGNKGLIVLDGLPNEDSYDVREKIFQRIKDSIRGTGAIINYKKVEELLPHGIKCSEEYLNKLLSETEDIAEKICEVTEYLFDMYYSKEKFPKVIDTSYADFYSNVSEDENMTWNQVICERCAKYLFFRMLTMIDYRIKARLDVSMLLERVGHLVSDTDYLDNTSFQQLIVKANHERDNCIVTNADLMMNDQIDMGILLNALYSTKQYEQIKQFPYKDLGAYHLFRGFVAYEVEEDYLLAIREMEIYMSYSLDREFVKEITDMSNNKMKAFYLLISLLANMGKNEKAKYYYDEMSKYYYSLYGDYNIDDKSDANQIMHHNFLCQSQEMIMR